MTILLSSFHNGCWLIYGVSLRMIWGCRIFASGRIVHSFWGYSPDKGISPWWWPRTCWLFSGTKWFDLAVWTSSKRRTSPRQSDLKSRKGQIRTAFSPGWSDSQWQNQISYLHYRLWQGFKTLPQHNPWWIYSLL